MPLQTINLGDHINAAIDKMNENFELLDSNLSALDSDFLLALISEAGLEGTVDSAAIFAIIAETGLETRIDSTDSGLSLLAQDFTNLETQLTGVNSDFTALSIAQSNLSSRIDITDSNLSIISSDITNLEAQYLELDSNLDSNISALATAQSELTSRIDVTDSNVSVLSQSLIDLEAEFQAGIGVDSAQLAQAVSTATQDISSRIDANSDEISIVSQSVTDLSADLTIFDSNLQAQITANADAVSTLVSRVNYNSDELELLSGSFDSFQVTFQNALDSGIRVNSDDIAAAVGGVSGDLYAKIYANSDAIVVIGEDIVQIESKLVLLDSDGALVNILAEADQSLRSYVDQQDSAGLVRAISEFNTALSAYVDSEALSTADLNLRSYVEQQDSATLASAISEFELRLTSYIDSAQFAIAEQNIYTAIDSAGTEVGYTLNLNANGHVAGIQFNNDGATADMSIIADKFGIVNASNNAIKPFTVDGDNVLLSNATVTGQLNISSTGNGGSMTMTNDVMTIFDSAGNTRVVFGRLA
jgi:hypothetical protein